jgi:hypothetical protein
MLHEKMVKLAFEIEVVITGVENRILLNIYKTETTCQF